MQFHYCLENKQRFMRSTWGFTLIELVTVIAVMSIVAAVAAPRFIGSDSFDTRGNVGMLISSLRYAQKTAISQHRMVYVRVDNLNQTLRLCYSADCTSMLQDPVQVGSYELNFHHNVNIVASLTTLGFNIDGTPNPNMNVSYTLSNRKNNAQTSVIQVEANTGYVHLL